MNTSAKSERFRRIFRSQYTSMCIANLMHKGNSLQELFRHSEKSFRLENISTLMDISHHCINRRAKQLKHQALMKSIRSLVGEVVE